jgi:thiamine biosynthesis lipoprotein
MQIDLGGIAKGWIVEHAAKILKDCTQACAVNAGGDMTLVNLPPGESTWEVGLEDPAAPERDLAVLRVDPGGVATSSITKRQWYHNSRLQHHLIDPRTGMSAQTDWLSVTVWAQRLLEAEVYAKTLLIGGSQSVGASLKNSDSIAYLAVDKQGWVMGSENYHEVFHV